MIQPIHVPPGTLTADEGAGWGAPLVAASPGALEPPGLPGLSIPLREVFGR